MRSTIKNLVVKKIRYIIIFAFLCFSLIPIFNADHNYYYNGQADYLSPIDSQLSFFRGLFVYDSFLNGGIDRSNMIAQTYPFNLIFLFFESVNISPSLGTYIYISLIIFLSEISLFLYFKHLSEDYYRKKINIFLMFVGFSIAIIYGFSPFFITQVKPGHFTLLFIYATFPFVLKYLDLIFFNNQKHYKKLFFIFLLQASSCSNIAMLVIELILISLYAFFFLILHRKWFYVTKKTIYIVFLSLLSNIWWLLSFFINLRKIYITSSESNLIGGSIGFATQTAQINNIFLGIADFSLYFYSDFSKYYLSLVSLIFFILLIPFFVLPFLEKKKNKLLIIFTFILLISIFITKGPQNPGGYVFMIFYNNLPGFQIFRRPVSKFYWVFLLFYLIIVYMAILKIDNKKLPKLIKYVISIFFFLGSIYFTISFCSTATIPGFNIPTYYYEAKDYLLKNNVNKLLILPNLDGMQPKYDNSLKFHEGGDFIYNFFNFNLLLPDNTNYSAELPSKRIANEINKKIINNNNFCELSKEIGVSHIMVHNDTILDSKQSKEKKAILNYLNSINYIKNVKYFFDKNRGGIYIFSLANECIGNLVSIETNKINNEKYFYYYQMINPVTYLLHVNNISGDFSIKLRNNYDNFWNIYTISSVGKKNINKNFTNKNTYDSNYQYVLPYKPIILFNTPFVKNNFNKSYSYLNQWNIKADNNDSKTYDFIIYYNQQNYFYLGALLFIISFLFITIKVKDDRKENRDY